MIVAQPFVLCVRSFVLQWCFNGRNSAIRALCSFFCRQFVFGFFPLSGFVIWLLGFSGLFEDPDFYDFPDSLEFPDSLNFPDFLDFLEFPDFLDFPDILDFPDFWIFWIFWIFLIFIFSLAQGSGRSVLVSSYYYVIDCTSKYP
mgnify:CR=1 FL=1